MAKNPIFLEFIFFYLLIPLMGHHNAPKKCCRAKLGGGACRPPVAPNLFEIDKLIDSKMVDDCNSSFNIVKFNVSHFYQNATN